MPGKGVLLSLLFLLIAAPAAADIIETGTKGVEGCVTIDNTGDYPFYVFVVFPLSVSGGFARMGPGDCISPYKFAFPSFYAVKKEAFDEAAAGGEKDSEYFSGNPAIIRSGISIFSRDTVPEGSPVTKIATIYTIRSVNATRLDIVESRELISYENGTTLEIPVGTATTPATVPRTTVETGRTTPAPAAAEPVTLVLTGAAGTAIALAVVLRERKH